MKNFKNVLVSLALFSPIAVSAAPGELVFNATAKCTPRAEFQNVMWEISGMRIVKKGDEQGFMCVYENPKKFGEYAKVFIPFSELTPEWEMTNMADGEAASKEKKITLNLELMK